MRRFSQRNPLVTLSDINITPLLDLAFVLLIIFVITTPLLDKSIDLKLPRGGVQDNPKIDPRNVRTVEVSNTGVYALNRRRVDLPQMISRLAQDFRANPNLIVYIRADKDAPYGTVATLIDGCQKNGITRYSLRTDPTTK
ncbi:MAG TPA: biopolymer transporter ExbD [Candidatus Paceibacterota bacterium]|nr:biopolymer transporter ExbD [Candidatus Paceibacterota bacterium]